MTARSSQLGSFSYATESSFCENVTTFGTRLLPVDTIDFSSLEHPSIDINPLKQRAHEGEQNILVGYGGSISATFILGGHGGTAATSLTATALSTLLQHFIGAQDASSVGTTVSVADDADSFTTAGGTFADGSLCRVGALGDGKAEGQFAVVTTGPTSMVLGTALPAAPAASDVVYGALVVYPEESPSQSHDIQSIRIEAQSANKIYRCHGCFPQAIAFDGLNVGEVPRVTLTWGVAYWNSAASSTFPNTTATDMKVGAVVAQGSVFMNTALTSTRITRNIRNWDLSIDLNVVPVTGPGGVFAHQTIVGATRVNQRATFSLTMDAEATGTETFKGIYDTAAGSRSKYQILNTLSAEDGRAICFYFPNAAVVSPVPTQQDVEGLNRVTLSFRADTHSDTDSELTLSSWRMGLG